MLSPVRAVLFDLDGALFDHFATVRSLAAGQAVDLKGLLPAELHGRFVERMLELEALGYLDRLAVYRHLVHELQLDAGHRRLHPRRLATDFDRRYCAHALAWPGARDTLTGLKARGLRLGIVCNGRAAAQGAKVDALGIRELLDDVLVSEQAGVRKPDPAIYRQALERLGVEAQQALHVGEHPQRDVSAARAAGLQAAWLRRCGTHAASPPEADATLDGLAALLDVLPRPMLAYAPGN